MTKSAAPLSTIVSATTAAFVTHTFVRLRGPQTGTIGVADARTPQAKVTLAFGGALMTFWSAAAAAGVLEGVSAARATLIHLPAALPGSPDPYGISTIAVDWMTRPSYAVTPQARMIGGNRKTLRYTDVKMGPITWQLLDRAAFHATVDMLREVHAVAGAVLLDGPEHRTDPTGDDYVSPR